MICILHKEKYINKKDSTRRMDIENIIAFYRRHNRDLRISVNGDSMFPILKNREKVRIRFYQKKPKVGDIILFFAKGEYVIHRIVSQFSNEQYVTKGDANLILDDELIERSQIVGYVDIKRKSIFLIFLASRLSFLQGKYFCFMLKKKNMALTRIVCARIQKAYQWILKRVEIPL